MTAADPHVAGVGAPTAPEYLVVDEVAALLRLTTKAFYRWLESEPTFPVLRLGRGPRARLRFPRRRLEAWLAQRERGGGQIKRLELPR